MNSSNAHEQAIAWLVRLQTAEEVDRLWPDFEAWLDNDPHHPKIYAKVEHMWSDLDFLKELVRQEESRSVKALMQAVIKESRNRRIRTSIRIAGFLILIGGSATLLMDVFRAPITEPIWATYERGADQVTPVTLDDGSSVQLNNNTHIRIGGRGRDREILLDNGEAYFDVKPRAVESFKVNTGIVVIMSHDAAFSIKKEGDGHIEALVRRGKVEITSNEARRASAAEHIPLYQEVSEGQMAMLSPSNHLDIVTINQSELQQRLDWTSDSPLTSRRAHELPTANSSDEAQLPHYQQSLYTRSLSSAN